MKYNVQYNHYVAEGGIILSLADELKKERENKLFEHALEFVGNIELTLRKSASEGYTGFKISLEDRQDAHILKNSTFIEYLETLLDGCVVKIITDEHTDIFFNTKYYKSILYIGWREVVHAKEG